MWATLIVVQIITLMHEEDEAPASQYSILPWFSFKCLFILKRETIALVGPLGLGLMAYVSRSVVVPAIALRRKIMAINP